MFDSVKKLEKKISNILKEIDKHETKRKNAKSSEDATIHRMRKEAAMQEHQRLRAKLFLAKAAEETKRKKS